MSQYSCVIIDDEELARDLLENFISRVPELKLIGKFSSPLEALASFRDHAVEILFLDIQMPEMTGIEFLQSLSQRPAVVFTTAYDNYALKGYELAVVDYLLKPFGLPRFLQAVNKATEWIELRREKEGLKLSTPKEASPEYLLINADHKVHRLYLQDILYIQSMKEYVAYYTPKGKIMALGSLKGLEESLPKSEFLRIHKSYIVAKRKVSTLEGNQLQVGGVLLPIGGSYKAIVLEELF